MIKEISFKDTILWNDLVKSFEKYDVFYLNEYSVAFMNENKNNGIPILLYYENGTDRGINVVFKRDISEDNYFKDKIEKNKYFDLITPYGYGGFYGTIKDYSALNNEYNKYCVENGYICEFVRFELFSDYYKYYDGNVETKTHNVIRNLDISLDEMWRDFKPKVRKNVNRANSYGLEIIIENTKEHLDDFLEIYYSTMNRCNANEDFSFSREFFETINSMSNNIMYFYAVFDKKIVSAELVIFGSDNCYSYLGGTNSDYFYLRPNDYLKYEIIKWAKNKGFKNFVLGGGYGSDDGIFQYKQYLAPKGVVNYNIGKKIINEDVYNLLVELRDNKDITVEKTSFFPTYRI